MCVVLRKAQIALRIVTGSVAVLGIALGVSGCLSSLSDGPERLVSIVEETSSIRAQFGSVPRDYFSWAEWQKVAFRDEFITARMSGIDIQFSAYETSLRQERQQLGFLATTTNIALMGTSSLIAPVQTKNILSAAAGGLTGANAAYNDDILLNRTIQVLQSQMRANRSRKAAFILAKLGSPISVYPIGMAQSDLEDYYQAGTLTSALVEVTHSVAQQAINAKYEKEGAIVITQPASDETYRALISLLYPRGIRSGINVEVRDEVLKVLGKNKASYPLYLHDPKYSVVRFELAQCVRLYRAGTPCKPDSLP